MTITKKHLIDAAKAIGINAHQDQKHPNNPPLFLGKFGEFNRWNPEHNKSQLMDLQWKLKIRVMKNNRGKTFISYDVVDGIFLDTKYIVFSYDNFESFATAIILAAAEIGRGMK